MCKGGPTFVWYAKTGVQIIGLPEKVTGANALAYCTPQSVARKISFISLTLGATDTWISQVGTRRLLCDKSLFNTIN